MNDAPFEVGDTVTSPWDPAHGDLIRTVTAVVPNEDYVSGWVVSADNGNNPETKPIKLVDASWFYPA